METETQVEKLQTEGGLEPLLTGGERPWRSPRPRSQTR